MIDYNKKSLQELIKLQKSTEEVFNKLVITKNVLLSHNIDMKLAGIEQLNTLINIHNLYKVVFRKMIQIKENNPLSDVTAGLKEELNKIEEFKQKSLKK